MTGVTITLNLFRQNAYLLKTFLSSIKTKLAIKFLKFYLFIYLFIYLLFFFLVGGGGGGKYQLGTEKVKRRACEFLLRKNGWSVVLK